MDVRQISVRFFALKSAKGVLLASKVCKGCHFQAIKVSKLHKIIIFFDQIAEILQNFSIMQKFTARNSFFGVLGYICWKIFLHLSATLRRVQNFGLQRVRVSLTHIHILHYIGVPRPPPGTGIGYGPFVGLCILCIDCIKGPMFKILQACTSATTSIWCDIWLTCLTC